jgi:hypothetical protein
MKFEPKHFRAGQQLWYVPGQYRTDNSRYVTIERVGREYLHTACRLKIRIDNLREVVTLGTAGQCYTSREAHDSELEMDVRWNRIRNAVERSYGRPASISLMQLSALEGALLSILEKK